MFNHFIVSGNKTLPFSRLHDLSKPKFDFIYGCAPYKRSIVYNRKGHSVSCHRDGAGNACFTQFYDDYCSTLVLKELCDTFDLAIQDGSGIEIHLHNLRFLTMYEEFRTLTAKQIASTITAKEDRQLTKLAQRWRKLASRQGFELNLTEQYQCIMDRVQEA